MFTGPRRIDGCDHGIEHHHAIVKAILSKKTHRGQLVEMDEFENFGIGVSIDGEPQFSELDTDMFHQPFAHQALPFLRDRRHIGICGGGDFGLVREIVRYPDIETITVIDWDFDFMEIAKGKLEFVHQGAWRDPRVSIEEHCPDAFDFIAHTEKRFNAIFWDLTDMTTTRGIRPNFVRLVKRLLAPGGVWIIQAGQLSKIPAALDAFLENLQVIAPEFARIWVSKRFIPFFSYEQAWIIATDDGNFNPLIGGQENFGILLAHAIRSDEELSEYSGKTHFANFALSPSIHRAIKRILGSKFLQQR